MPPRPAAGDCRAGNACGCTGGLPATVVGAAPGAGGLASEHDEASRCRERGLARADGRPRAAVRRPGATRPALHRGTAAVGTATVRRAQPDVLREAAALPAGHQAGACPPGRAEGARRRLDWRAFREADERGGKTARSSVPEASEGQGTEHVEARAGAYADSITLMLASTDVRAVPGVEPPTPPRSAACPPPGPGWPTCGRPATCWACAPASSCTRARSSAGTGRPCRCGVRSWARPCWKAWLTARTRQRTWPQAGHSRWTPATTAARSARWPG